jgi:signal transduction histidine kinase
MKRTLFFKLMAGYLLFGVLSFFIVSGITRSLVIDHMVTQSTSSLYEETNQIASTCASDYYNGDISLSVLQSEFDALALYLDARIWLMTPNGKVVLSSSSSDIGSEFSQFDPTSGYMMRGTFYHTFSEDALSVYSPVTANYKVRGYIMIHKSISSITEDADSLMNVIYLTLLLIFLCAFILMAVILYVVYFPIRRITRVADDYARGDFTPRIKVSSNDEIGYLAASLNYMAAELDSLEEDQRKFVSNVSHDFRSPLTSIKGYVEAILDGTIPYEMQDKYLNIILNETGRLTKLTSSLLELNNYDSRHSIMEIAPFDLNAIIKSTAASFEGTCSAKHLTIELVLTDTQMVVRANEGKIQQVLYNLLDNAIKFSPEDSVITIETTQRSDKVFVSVKDRGIGISRENLNKIWERFYKIDSSRGKDKKGTGLGLSIVKEIILAHNENINVISTEGVGTEFIFTLPVSHENDE